MKIAVAILVTIMSVGSLAQEIKIVKKNAYGRTLHHEGSYAIKKNRVVKINPYGRTLYHKPTYKIETKR